MVKYSTPKGVTYKQYESMLDTHPYRDYVHSRKRGKRIRQLISSIVFFDLNMDDEYTTRQIVDMGHKYNPTGNSAMSLSPQKVGACLSTMCRLGILKKRVDARSRSHYTRLI